MSESQNIQFFTIVVGYTILFYITNFDQSLPSQVLHIYLYIFYILQIDFAMYDTPRGFKAIISNTRQCMIHRQVANDKLSCK